MSDLIAKAQLSANLTTGIATVDLDIHTDPAKPMVKGQLQVDIKQEGALVAAIAPLLPPKP